MAYDHNRFEMIGRVARVSPFNNATKICIATNLPSKDQNGQRSERAYFNDVTVFFDKTRKFVDEYVGEGDLLFVEGQIQNGVYEKDGVKHYPTNLVVRQLRLLAKKNAASNGNGSSNGGDDPSDPDIPF